jgi:hypothetical protein
MRGWGKLGLHVSLWVTFTPHDLANIQGCDDGVYVYCVAIYIFRCDAPKE